MKSFVALSLALVSAVRAGTVVWSGSFNGYTTPADFDKWSWSNQVGAYQWYIHGSQPTSNYLQLSPSYKNPAETRDVNGLRLRVDGTSKWNGGMERTELIPQTTANLGTGRLFYHFSLKRGSTNVPTLTEHQVCFFESHFTEFKIGVGSNPTALQWYVGGQPKWSTDFPADVWYNFAYDIDFSGRTVGLYASTGSSPLVKVVENIAASPSTNSADWHLGVLRLGTSSAAEDWYFSGVYIESGSINTSIGNGSTNPVTSVPVTSTRPVSSSTRPVSSSTPSTTSSASGPYQTQYGQCGGTGYTGPTTCAPPLKCVAVSPPYYYQCQA